MERVLQNAMHMRRSSAFRRLTVVKNHLTTKQCQCNITTASQPTIHLSRVSALVDESISISVTGLAKGQKVTLQTLVDQGKSSFGSCGFYKANDDGNIDTFKNICHGGTFDGLEPMGLFWSMQSLPGSKPRRVINSDVTRPFNVKISIHPDFVPFDKLNWSGGDSALAQCDFQQTYMSHGVRCVPVRENGIVGTLFLPPGKGPFPAVIDLFGMAGVSPGHRSSLLASRGIASFVLKYVGQDGLPNSPDDLDFSYFLKAFDWLVNHPSIDSEAMGGLGSCIGATYVGLIAWKRPALKCLVSINSPFRPDGPTQEVEGESVERPLEPWPLSDGLDPNTPIALRNYIKKQHGSDRLPFWRHGLKLLHIQCDDDQCFWPDVMEEDLKALPAQFSKNFEFLRYPGAGHILEPPYIPLCRANYNPIFDVTLLWGGQPREHAHAQMDSWPRIIQFFKQHLTAH